MTCAEETPEQLVLRVQAGEKDAVALLWESVRRFVAREAFRTFNRSRVYAEENKKSFTVETDDLIQVGFIAMLKAAESFDAGAGASFLTHYKFYLRSAFAETCGYRGTRRNPLNDCLSLDAPVPGGDDESDMTYADTVRDDSAEDAFTAADDAIYNDQLHAALEAELDVLPPIRAEIIRATFWEGRTQADIAAERGCSGNNVHAQLKNGLNDLRRGSSARRLREFLDERTDYYTRVGARTFRTTLTSAVEANVIRREAWAEDWRRGHEESRDTD